MSEQSDLRETVRAGYAAAALKVTRGGTACCGPGEVEVEVEVDESFGSGLYDAEAASAAIIAAHLRRKSRAPAADRSAA